MKSLDRSPEFGGALVKVDGVQKFHPLATSVLRHNTFCRVVERGYLGLLDRLLEVRHIHHLIWHRLMET